MANHRCHSRLASCVLVSSCTLVLFRPTPPPLWQSLISNVASLAWIILLQISIAVNSLYQTTNINTQTNLFKYANTPFTSFLVFAVEVSSKRSCNANCMSVRWDAKGLKSVSKYTKNSWKYQNKNEKTKIKHLWLRLWDSSEIHRPLHGYPGSGPMYPSNRPCWLWQVFKVGTFLVLIHLANCTISTSTLKKRSLEFNAKKKRGKVCPHPQTNFSRWREQLPHPNSYLHEMVLVEHVL